MNQKVKAKIQFVVIKDADSFLIHTVGFNEYERNSSASPSTMNQPVTIASDTKPTVPTATSNTSLIQDTSSGQPIEHSIQ
ncbi:hypothetical protein [Brevibacillus laterosporus]|uniref:Uncharacterized protein n=1 Tax=Brevibacillus laterosporus TaxID=1465 RepID=A0AAP8QFN0_BRELA|nr:hypothetical protein [Brevibacillus laterosporus]PPB10714.1 hypothetical protein C4A77_03540 [Brevibacillus laterosporus]